MGNIHSRLEGVNQSHGSEEEGVNHSHRMEDGSDWSAEDDADNDDDIDRVMRQISLAVSRSRGVSSLSRAVAKEEFLYHLY